MSGFQDAVEKYVREQIKDKLKKDAELFKSLLEYYINDYRKAFTPKRYSRRGDLERSVYVDVVIKELNGGYSIFVGFDPNMVNHRSGYGVWAVKDGRGKFDDDDRGIESSGNVNVIRLINNGYRVKKPVWFKDLENFGYREGAGFIQKAINDFNAQNSLGIILTDSDIVF